MGLERVKVYFLATGDFSSVSSVTLGDLQWFMRILMGANLKLAMQKFYDRLVDFSQDAGEPRSSM